MFYIEDGREHFYQWDIDRRLVVEDETIKEVHFCNRTGDCSLVCEVYFHDNDFGGVYVVNVPNILLQTDWKIRVYAYDGKHTRYDACYEVKSRTKPSDYVYTETEIKNYDAVLAQVAELEAIAKGRSKGYVFDTVEDLDEWLANRAFTSKLLLGDNLYIRATDTPDYWWDGSQKQPLETQKVEFSDYVKFTDYATKDKTGVVKTSVNWGIGNNSDTGLWISAATETEIKGKKNYYKPIVPANLEYAVKSVGDGYYATTADVEEAINNAFASIVDGDEVAY